MGSKMPNPPWRTVEEALSLRERALRSGFDRCSSLALLWQCVLPGPRRRFLYKGIDNARVRIPDFLNSSAVTAIPRLGMKEELGCGRIEALDFNGNNGILESGRGGCECPRQWEAITITAAVLEWSSVFSHTVLWL